MNGGEGERALARMISEQAIVKLYRLAIWLAAVTPAPLADWLALAGGSLYFWLNPSHSRHAVNNLAVVLRQPATTPAVRRLARQSFAGYALTVLDFLRLPSLPAQSATSRLSTEGWEHLDAALAAGRGVVIVAIHFGSWDRAVRLLSERGYRAHLLVDRLGPPALDGLIQAERAAPGLCIVSVASVAGLRQAYRALERNEIVVMLGDRPLTSGGTPVRLFGRLTRWPSGPAALVRRTGARLLHAHLARRPGRGSYQGALEPIAIPAPSDDRERDEAAIMQAIAERAEQLIRRQPEQWYMFRPMWRS